MKVALCRAVCLKCTVFLLACRFRGVLALRLLGLFVLAFLAFDFFALGRRLFGVVGVRAST